MFQSKRLISSSPENMEDTPHQSEEPDASVEEQSFGRSRVLPEKVPLPLPAHQKSNKFSVDSSVQNSNDDRTPPIIALQ